MNPLQNITFKKLLDPIDINGATATDTEIDTLGYHYLVVYIVTGNVADDMTALTLNESDTAAQTGTAFVTFTAPLGTGGDNTRRAAFIDLRKRKRYVSLVATAASAATLICAIGILSRGDENIQGITGHNLDEEFVI